MIADISPFTVDDETSFTKATFTRLSAVAQAMLDSDNPGLSGDLYDHAHALLICHLFTSCKEDRGMLKSESIGGYSYSKDAGTSSYMLQYQAMISSRSASQILEGQERADSEMSDMHLDQAEVPDYGED
jgi:hypothetical protein